GDAKHCNEPAARALIRRSTIAPYLRWSMPLAAAAVLVLMLAFVAKRPTWDQERVGSVGNPHGELFLIEDSYASGIATVRMGGRVMLFDLRKVQQLRDSTPSGVFSKSRRYLYHQIGGSPQIVDLQEGRKAD